MRKRIILAFVAVMVMGLGVAAVAYSRANNSASAAMSCCGDSCPMKNKGAAHAATAGSHENCDCCKGDAASCPMKGKGEHTAAMHQAHPESCPMKNKDAATAVAGTEVKHEMAAGETCCCSCCSKEKTDAPAV